jgi:hypothetical protein
MRPFQAALDRLDEIPGVGQRAAEQILVETGTGGGNRWLRTSLLEAAWTVSHSRKPTFFTARYHRLAARRGRKRAAVAIAHSLLIAVYHVLKDGVVFNDLGPTHFERRNQEAIVRRSLHRLEALGYKVTVEAMPA